jgi:hypothetical protein
MKIVSLAELLKYGVSDFASSVPHIYDHRPTARVQEAATVLVQDDSAIAFDGRG